MSVRSLLQRRAAFAGLVLSAGCSAALPRATVTDDIANATALASKVALRFDPEPVAVPHDSPTLPLATAVELAMHQDPRLQIALARVEQALADAGQARLLPNPFLSVIVRFPEGGGSANVEAGLTADLLAIAQIPGRSSAADHRFRAAGAEAVRTALDVITEVQESYASVQAFDALLPVLAARRTLVLRLLDFARTKLAAGEGIRTDVTILESQRIDLEIETARAEQERREERLHLARLIGDPLGEARWSLKPWRAPELGPLVERDWLAAALAHRPELLAVQWQLAALGDDFSLAKWMALGPLAAGVDAERDGGWRIGPQASFSIPIFDTGQARRDHIRAEIAAGRHELTLLGRTVVEEVRRALTNLAYAQATLARVRDELIPKQSERRELAEQIFRLGQSDVTGAFLAEHDLRAAEARRIQLERQVSVSLVRLQRAVGGPGVAMALTAAPNEQKEQR